MKLKDYLKLFDGLDLETEIYHSSNEDDDGERILYSEFEFKQVAVIDCPYYKDTLMIPNEYYRDDFHKSKKVWVIL